VVKARGRSLRPPERIEKKQKRGKERSGGAGVPVRTTEVSLMGKKFPQAQWGKKYRRREKRKKNRKMRKK